MDNIGLPPLLSSPPPLPKLPDFPYPEKISVKIEEPVVKVENPVVKERIVKNDKPVIKKELSDELKNVAKKAITKHLIEKKPRTIIKDKDENDKRPKTTKVTSSKKEVEKVRTEDKPAKRDETLKSIDGVHIDIFDYFDLSPSVIDSKQLDRLKIVNDWAWDGSDNINKVLSKVQSLELKLGKNYTDGSLLTKICNWIRIKGHNVNSKT